MPNLDSYQDMKFHIRVNMVLHKFVILRFFASFQPSAITFPFSCRLEIYLPMSVECEFLSFTALSPSLPLCCKSDLFIPQFASADSKVRFHRFIFLMAFGFA
ncbi:hypothetical protein ABFS83_11G108200 [Erythranthe nasuta]